MGVDPQGEAMHPITTKVFLPVFLGTRPGLPENRRGALYFPRASLTTSL